MAKPHRLAARVCDSAAAAAMASWAAPPASQGIPVLVFFLIYPRCVRYTYLFSTSNGTGHVSSGAISVKDESLYVFAVTKVGKDVVPVDVDVDVDVEAVIGAGVETVGEEDFSIRVVLAVLIPRVWCWVGRMTEGFLEDMAAARIRFISSASSAIRRSSFWIASRRAASVARASAAAAAFLASIMRRISASQWASSSSFDDVALGRDVVGGGGGGGGATGGEVSLGSAGVVEGGGGGGALVPVGVVLSWVPVGVVLSWVPVGVAEGAG